MEFSGRFPLSLTTARIEWRGEEPFAADYGDIYFAPGQGMRESETVFLQGCGIHELARSKKAFAVLETGFGTGLNFLLTADACESTGAFLHFVSLEKHPLKPEDLARVLARYPASRAKTRLLAHYPPAVPGFHTIEITPHVLLTLVYGDASDMAGYLSGSFDAFYLDGFAPAKNPDFWNQKLFETLAKLARPGAKLATFTAAGAVRRGLESAGFSVEKVPGFEGKREMIRAVFRADLRQDEPQIRTAAVIGAGIAGAACARALKRRGIEPVVFEASAPASGASGNRFGIFQPVLSAQRTVWSRWTLNGFWFLQSQSALESVVHGRGLFQAARTPAEEEKLKKALSFMPLGRWVETHEARSVTGIDAQKPGVFFERAGYLSPKDLVERLIEDSQAAVKTARASVEAGGDGVLVRTAEDSMSFDVCVLCPGSQIESFQADPDVRFEIVRGQINYLPAGSVRLSAVYCSEGYVIAGPDCTVIGSTYDRSSQSLEITRADQERIFAQLSDVLGLQDLGAHPLPGRASLRVALSDHLPWIGRIRGQLYVSTGHGSRGMISAPLAAEVLAAKISGMPLPVESDLAEFFENRFRERKARREARARPPRPAPDRAARPGHPD